MTSLSVKGFSRFRRLLMFSRTNCRSSSVTNDSGRSTRVSVVPMQVRGPIGITKNMRPSSAKKVRTRLFGVSFGTMRWMPFEKTWRQSVVSSVVLLCASANGPQALTTYFALVSKVSPLSWSLSLKVRVHFRREMHPWIRCSSPRHSRSSLLSG